MKSHRVGKPLRLVLALLAANCVTGQVAHSRCYPITGALEEIEIESCRPPDVDVGVEKAKQFEHLDLVADSPRAYVEKVLADDPGVMVGVRVLRRREMLRGEPLGLTGKNKRGRIGPWAASGDVQTYFHASGSQTSCGGFTAGETQQRYIQKLCCDVHPPYSVGCLYGVSEIMQPPDWAAQLLEKKKE
jgi:hypothetical protein